MKLAAQKLKLRAISLLSLLPPSALRLLPIGTLVNSDNIRSTVKRMFSNKPSEILGELFQNSARAGARRVTITTREGGFTVSDDGTGVEGVKGFQALLKIAETRYANPGVAQQHPMGVGLMSLLSHSSVRSVTFASGNLELTVETEKWFGDDAYSRTWFNRLRARRDRAEGLTISVECEPEMVKALKPALAAQDRHGNFSPAQGYDGVLEITLDGRPVETRLPLWATITHVLVDTTYEGARLLVGFRGDAGHCERSSSVNWYGQIIPVRFEGSFDFHLEVTSGRAVEPRSPSREGLVENESYHRLIAFVKDRIFGYLFDPRNRAAVQPWWISASAKLDRRRALRESPYYVAKTLLPLADAPENEGQMDVVGDDVLFAYADDAQPLLLDGGVTLLLDGERLDHDNGLCTFLGMTGPAHRLSFGDDKRLAVKSVWWRLGAQAVDFFREPGEWGFGLSDAEPDEWRLVTDDNVFTYSQAANWDIGDAEMTAAASDPITFLDTVAWAAWSYEHDQASWAELHESFEGSLKAMIRRLMGNCVPATFNARDVEPFFSREGSRVATITFIYGDQAGPPGAISATSQHGETVELKLVA